jgi:glycosyltransferase involved in cell wall biosynthesis
MEFTVFTPVFNGASTIDRVYKSLLQQTHTEFEWLIIDDGSTDYTADVIKSMIDENKVSIRFHRQNNMHKFFTLHEGISMASGYFFLIADADDEFEPGTLERLSATFKAMPSDIQDFLLGVNCLCKNGKGEIIGDQYPENLMISDHCEMHHRYNIKGEKWGMQRTEILRKFRFSDEYFNNGYIPENVLWSSIANAGYKIVFINEALRTYHNEGLRKSISTTGKKNIRVNSFGCMQDMKGELNTQLKYFANDPLYFLKATILYMEASGFQKVSVRQQVQNLTWPATLLYLIMYPISLPLLWYRKKRLPVK